jgi:hypothetical protein
MSPHDALRGSTGMPRRWGSTRGANLRTAVARLILGVIAGCATGALTEWSVPHLSFSLAPLCNSAAPWVLVAFGVALTARGQRESVVLATVTLIALVVGFYVAQDLRGWAVSRHQLAFWSVSGLVVGPIVGLAAGWLRHAGRMEGALGAGVIGGVLVGEAVHGLTALKFATPAEYWHVQLVLGLGLAVGLTLWRNRRRGFMTVASLAASGVACAIVGIGTLLVYQVP